MLDGQFPGCDPAQCRTTLSVEFVDYGASFGFVELVPTLQQGQHFPFLLGGHDVVSF